MYGSADPALTETVPAGALETGDSLSGNLTRAAGNTSASYAITQGTRTAGPNYDLTVTPGTLTITRSRSRSPPTTRARSSVRPIRRSPTCHAGGPLVTGDSFTGSLTRVAGETVGTYAIQVGTLTAGGNYTLTFVGANLSIIYGWDGFLQPINDTAHQTGVAQSKFKLGQTIPAKFVIKNAAGVIVQQVGNPTFSRSGNLGACDATTTAETTPRSSPRTPESPTSGTAASTTTTGARRASPAASTGSTRTSPTARSATWTSA